MKFSLTVIATALAVVRFASATAPFLGYSLYSEVNIDKACEGPNGDWKSERPDMVDPLGSSKYVLFKCRSPNGSVYFMLSGSLSSEMLFKDDYWLEKDGNGSLQEVDRICEVAVKDEVISGDDVEDCKSRFNKAL
jgi:hypothetical protein